MYMWEIKKNQQNDSEIETFTKMADQEPSKIQH